ncbi:MAG: hypothetical protein GY941_13480 [Planctomycetes bacterium]|nr:hypothetical protein [Planctomycetota bacterium]
MFSDFKVPVDKDHRKNEKVMQRLGLIKERYKKLIVNPKKEIAFEIEIDLREENDCEDTGRNGWP